MNKCNDNILNPFNILLVVCCVSYDFYSTFIAFVLMEPIASQKINAQTDYRWNALIQVLLNVT